MSAFHTNDLHREFVSSFRGIRWGLVQFAGRIFMVRYWTTIIRWCLLALHFPTKKRLRTLDGASEKIESARVSHYNKCGHPTIMLENFPTKKRLRVSDGASEKIESARVSHYKCGHPTKKRLRVLENFLTK